MAAKRKGRRKPKTKRKQKGRPKEKDAVQPDPKAQKGAKPDSAETKEAPAAPDDEVPPPDMAARTGPPMWVLAVCGLLATLTAVLPWARAQGGSVFLWEAAKTPLLLGKNLLNPAMVPAFLIYVPLAGMALIFLAKAFAALQPWRAWIAAGLSGLFLTAANTYNPSLSGSVYEIHHASIWGMPLAVAGPLAAGAYWAHHMAPESRRWTRRVGLLFAVVLLCAALMPAYDLGERSIPFFGQLVRLGDGGVESASALWALLGWVAAAVLVWWALEPKKLNRRLTHGAALVVAFIYPLGLLTRGLLQSSGGLTPTIFGLAAAAFSCATAWSVAEVLLHPPAFRKRWNTRGVRETVFGLAVGVLLLGFFALETQAVGYTVTDENIYFYQANLIAQGALPYKDFFFAHPPVHILIPALLFSLFGFHLVLAKMISMGAGLLAGLFVMLTARRTAGRTAAVIAGALYLYAFAVLNAATNLTGVNLTVMFLTAGVTAAVYQRGLTAGILVGLAMSTGFYSAAAGAALLLAAFLYSTRFGLRFAIGLLGCFGLFNVVFLLIGGGAFLEGVYLYHGRKMPQDPRQLRYGQHPIKALFYNVYVLFTSDEFKKTCFYHGYLIWGFFVSLLIWIGVRARWLVGVRPCGRTDTAAPAGPDTAGALEKQKKQPRAARRKRTKSGAQPPQWWKKALSVVRNTFHRREGWAAVIGLLGLALVMEFSMFQRLYSFYFTLWYPFMAIMVAFGLVTLAKSFSWAAVMGPVAETQATPGKREEHSSKKTRSKDAGAAHHGATPTRKSCLVAGTLLTFLMALYPSCENWAHHVHESEFEHKGDRNDYPWRTPKILPGLGKMVKAVFWHDHRIRGQSVKCFRQFLWNKKRHFDTAPAIAAYVKKHTAPTETVAGSSAIAPLVALLSGRRVADNFVDTNTLRFRSGLVSEADFYQRVCSTPLAYLISAPRSFFSWRKMRHHQKFLRSFRFEKRFRDDTVRYGGTFTVRLLRRTTDADEPPYCHYKSRRSLRRTKRRMPGAVRSGSLRRRSQRRRRSTRRRKTPK
jgi:hypothetical protein